jgi:hypothetical protein
VASDEISVRLDEIVESLNEILKLTDALPPDAAVARVQGPNVGVTRPFYRELARVALLARAAATKNKGDIADLARAVSTTVKELEEADRITGEQAQELEELLIASEQPPTAGSQSYTPAPSPTPPTVEREKTGWT